MRNHSPRRRRRPARFYEGITLLFANPKKEFPQDFDPERPFKAVPLGNVSREGFVDFLNGRIGLAKVLLLEKFREDPTKSKLQSPLDVELRDNATYIVIPPTPPIPELYTNVTLIWGNPEENFPGDFDYKNPFGATVIDSVSRESFISRVEGEDCVAVLPLDDFLNFSLNPTAFILKEKTPREVELRDNATYILLHSGEKGLRKRVDDVSAWQRNHTDAEQRHVRSTLVKMLKEEDHTNVQPFCEKKVFGPKDKNNKYKFKEVDAAAIAEGCAMVAEHKHVMSMKGVEQLQRLITFIEKYRDQDGVGNVSQFRGKRIIGVLASATEIGDPEKQEEMNDLIDRLGYRKICTQGKYGDDPCSTFQASGDSCDISAPSVTPGTGPTAPSAVPCRGGRSLLAPMRGPAVLVRLRLVNNRVAGFRLTF